MENSYIEDDLPHQSIMESRTMTETKVIEIISEIIKIREKYKHLAEVSYPIWKQRFENDKNNEPNQSVRGGEQMTTMGKYEKLSEMIKKYGAVNFDEEFDLTMYAFVMNNIDELQNKGYQIKCHDGAFGYGYVSVKI